MEAAAQLFDIEEQKIARPMGEVDLLVGIHLAEIFPVVQATKGNLRLLKYQFGSGFLVDSVHPEIMPTGGRMDKEAFHIARCKLELNFEEPKYGPGSLSYPIELWPASQEFKQELPAVEVRVKPSILVNIVATGRNKSDVL